MNVNYKDNILLQRIANHLIISSTFLENLGLFHGKMGIVIFFYHYSRYTNNPLYEEFAGELLDEIFEEIHDKLPIDFENGFLGIGWGIEYLAEQKFISGDTNDILEEIEKKAMERDVRRISDMSLNTGLEGVLHYVLARLHGRKNINKIFDRQYFVDLYDVANNLQSIRISRLMNKLCDEYKNWYNNAQFKHIPLVFLKKFYSSVMPLDDNKIYNWKIGLKDGCAGTGMIIINFNKEDNKCK